MKNRNEIKKEYKWNTAHIYNDISDFEKDGMKLASIIEKISNYDADLKNSESVKNLLDLYFEGARIVSLMASYADRNRDTDMAVSEHQELVGIVEGFTTKLAAAASWMEPSFLELPEEKLSAYLDEFSDYSRYFHGLIRNKPHTLSKDEEKIMARFSSIAFADYEIYSTFSSSDMPYPMVKLSDGKEIELNTPAYSVHRQSDNRDDRKTVFDSYWGNYDKFKNSFAKMLHYQLKYYATNASIRKFDSSLHAALHHNELPDNFYTGLIENIRKTLPGLHRYLNLKKKVLKIEDLGYHDVYASLVPSTNRKEYGYEESVKVVSEAMAPMTEEYRKVITDGMQPGSGWVDVYPNKGKRDGAYMSGEAYDVHPFVLLNHLDDYNSLSTLAHEMGHALHSYYSNSAQPYPKADYSIFVAEVASIFNEILLINHLIDKTEDNEEKKFLLNHFIEMIRGTIFRQMQFAEFEKKIYERVESDQMLTPDFLNETYLKTLQEYYGEKEGCMKIDPLYAVEWAFIPHFYYNYYVYQYVVGFIGALTLATKVLEGSLDPQQYIDGFLKAGCSKAPVDILKDAGVDMTSEEPYKLAEKVFLERLEELEALLEEK